MGFLIFPTLLILTIVPGPRARDHALADFSRFSKAINREVSIVQNDGTVREGLLAAVGSDSVTMKFGSVEQAFSKAEIVSAERLKDGRIDGAIKGALWGFVIGALANFDCAENCHLWGYVAGTAGIGYLFDAAENNHQRLYRAPAPAAPPKPSMRFSFRF